MAHKAKTAQEFIQGSFSPIISVLCSPKVDNVATKNNLSFTELLQPFTTMDWEGQFREPGGSICTVKNWKLIIRDVNWKPLQPMEARRQLNNAALHNYNEKTVPLEISGRKLEVAQSTPWFDAWRDTYLEVQFPSDHEYTKHFLSCIMVGTSHDDNIVETFNTLNQQFAQLQNVTPPKLPKWFNSDILKSYLLLHDVSTVPKEKADAAFEILKQNFGSANCFMLAINSKSTADPCLPTDYWTQYVKRGSDTQISIKHTELSSSLTTTPMEPQVTFPPPGSRDENNIVNAETSHPLTTADTEVYDNANSLQTHSFSGSCESVSVSVCGKLADSSKEVHGAAMSAADIDNIKKFLEEYASKALLPHLEKQVAVLSEGAATKKGVSRSLISATKRWFNPGKPGVQTASNTIIYSSECPELQLRRLGDLWFMTGQWQRAFDAYHTAKREFYADSAWLCYAGALEMAALSAFMAGESNRKTHAYMEESITTYLNTCRMVQYAVRATLLSVLCLSGAGLPGEAAKQLIRMTSEDSDLRSAMLLEQAALCFLCGPGTKAMCRKYAFHMVLAGHRFSKSGQKKHAYRCYKQAYQVYAESGWRLATDHVQFALGRLAGALRAPREAVRWLRGPLAPRSRQPPHQQQAFLHEYMLAHQQWLETSDDFKELLPILPLPLLENEATTVLCVGPVPLSSPGRVSASSLTLHPEHDTKPEHQYWPKLEEMLLQVAQGSVPMIFKPSVDLYAAKTDCYPVVPQGEPIQISITLRNPLKIPLILKDVELLWQFMPSSEDNESKLEVLNNEPAVAAGHAVDATLICGQKIKSVLLEGECKKIITFALTPLQVGQLNVQGLAYKLFNPGEGNTDSGSVMISGKLDLLSGANDKSLQITVIPHAPCLQMTFSETCPEVISGELRTLDVELRNVGPVDMSRVHVAVSHPDCLTLVTTSTADDPFTTLYQDKYQEPTAFSEERVQRAVLWRRTAARHVSLAADSVPRGGAVRARLLLRAAAHAPALCLLAYYETGARARPYRLLRHVFRFKVTEAIELAITPKRSLRTKEEVIFENMNLAAEIKNICSDKDKDIAVEILEASLLSRQWKLTDLTAARNRDDALNAHEKLHLVFKAKRILEDLPEGKVEYSCLKVNEIPESADDVNVSPYCKFVMEHKPSCLESSEALYLEKNKTDGLIQSMFVLRWKAFDKTKNRIAVGQHCLWLECFTKAETRDELSPLIPPTLQIDETESKTEVTETKKSKDIAVVFRLEHSSHISHNFEKTKLCLVPVTVNIVNCYQVPVEVFIDMTKPVNREMSVLGWVGALSMRSEGESQSLGVSVRLERLEARRVALRGVCAAPGTYAVGQALSVSTRAPHHRATVSCDNNASLLVVQQA